MQLIHLFNRQDSEDLLVIQVRPTFLRILLHAAISITFEGKCYLGLAVICPYLF